MRWMTILLGVLVLIAGGLAGARAQDRPPAEAFAALPEISDAQLSPDGRHLAVIQYGSARSAAVLYDVEGVQGLRPSLLAPEDARITAVTWANGDRVLVEAREAGALRRQGGRVTRTQVISANADASRAVILQSRMRGLRSRDHRGASDSQSLLTILAGQDDTVLISARDTNGTLSVYSVDVESGTARLEEEGSFKERGARRTVRWLSNHDGTAFIRWDLDAASKPASIVIEARLGGGRWSELARYDLTGPQPIRFLAFGPHPEMLYALAETAAGQTALFEYDIPSRALGREVFVPERGAVTRIESDPETGALIAVHYTDDERGIQYLDPDLAALQATIDRSFAETSVNRILSSSRDKTLHVIRTSGPSVPAAFYIFNSATMEASRLGQAYPALDPARLAPVETMAFSARDGLDLRAYLTLPPGASDDPAPLVVLVHDGPARGLWPSFGERAKSNERTGVPTLTPEISIGRRFPGRINDTINIGRDELDLFTIAPEILTDQTFGGRRIFAVQEISRHGGRERRAVKAFDYLAQFLASRGYAVLQPNYRGSDGLGRPLLDAGLGEWGGAMQTDLLDAVAPLIRDGRVDGTRVCLAGQGYGGYAALMGAAQSSGALACAVAIAPLADLGLAIRDNPGAYAQAFWTRAFGPDWDQDTVRAARSPAALAGRMAVPVLLLHAEEDDIIPYAQSEEMARALTDAGQSVELVTLDGAGHGLTDEAARLVALRAMERFLDRHLAR